MTVIAAVVLHDNAVVIGDVVISSPTQREHYAQKVYRFGDNLALGWSGNYLQAKGLIEWLTAKLTNTRITYKQIRSVLSSFGSQAPDVDLAGWLFEGKRAIHISWSGSYPSALGTGTESSIGDGAPAFGLLLGEDGETNVAGIYRTVAAAIQKVGDARVQEMLHEAQWPISWGFGYDVVFYAEGMFMWVPSITCLSWDCHMNSTGEVTALHRNPGIYKQRRWRRSIPLPDLTIVQLATDENALCTTHVCEHFGAISQERLPSPPLFPRSFAYVCYVRLFVDGEYATKMCTAFVNPAPSSVLRVVGEFDEVSFFLDADEIAREFRVACPQLFRNALEISTLREHSDETSQPERIATPQSSVERPDPSNRWLRHDTVMTQLQEEGPVHLVTLSARHPGVRFMIVAGDAAHPIGAEFLVAARPVSGDAITADQVRDRIRAQVAERHAELGNLGFRLFITTADVIGLVSAMWPPSDVDTSVSIISEISGEAAEGHVHVLIITFDRLALGQVFVG